MSKRTRTPNTPEPVHVASDGGPGEVIHVPKGRSRWRFLLTIGAMIFVLIIFVVPAQFQALFAPDKGHSANVPFLTWKHPELGEQSLSQVDFMLTKQKLEKFYRVQRVEIRNRRTGRDLLADERVAYLVITDQVAREAGIEVTDRELAKTILEGDFNFLAPEYNFQPFGSKAVYEQVLAQADVAPTPYEETMRMLLRIQRYENMVGTALAVPTPEEIERLWKDEHQEFQVDVASLEIASFADAAKAAVPADDVLKTWYDALEDKARRFALDVLPDRTAAELAGYRFDGGASAAGLLAAYPRPEGSDPEALAKAYYDQFAHVRFRRAQPLEGEGDARTRLYMPYDEVAEAARREAPIHAALTDWLAAMKAREQAGEKLDLAAEAQKLDLQSLAQAEPLSREAWEKLDAWGGKFLAGAIMAGKDLGLVANVVVDEHAFAVVRTSERIAGGPPPFESVREKAIVEWTKDKQSELALEKLRGLRAPFLEAAAEGEEALPRTAKSERAPFDEKAKELGLEVVARDWFDPRTLEPRDSQPLTPVDAWLRAEYTSGASSVFGLGVSEIAEPAADAAGERVWIARIEAKRDPAVVAIQLNEAERLKQRAMFTGMQHVRDTILSPKAYAERYGMKFTKPVPKA